MVQDPFKYFRVEAHELVDQLGKGVVELEQGANGSVPKLLRLAHTLKGAARVVRRPDIAEYAHAIEDVLAPHREVSGSASRADLDTVLGLLDRIAAGLATLGSGEAADAQPENAAPAAITAAVSGDDSLRTVFAEVGDLDVLLDGVTETHAQLHAVGRAVDGIGRARAMAEQLADHIAARRNAPTARGDKFAAMAEELRDLINGIDRSLAAAHERMERELAQVHDAAEQLRLVPAGSLFAFLERAVADSARATGKLARFQGSGGEIRLDSHVLRVMHEALVQAVRNAVAHGIESESARRIAGKPVTGAVSVDVVRRGRTIVFRCHDDGRGVDIDAVRRAVMRHGMRPSEAQALSPTEAINLILKGGISTSAEVTELSGRGVGMDVVRAAVTRLGGELTATSEAGRGMTLEMSVPLTLAATEVLLVDCGPTVGIPFDAVRHVMHASEARIYQTAKGEEIVFDGKAIPFVRLSRWLAPDRPAGAPGPTIVVASGERRAAVGVNGLSATARVVYRSIPPLAPVSEIVAGASLDADGNPQLVLDPDRLVSEAEAHAAPAPSARSRHRPILVVDDSLTTRMLEQSILESAGYDVDLATSAEEALEIARRKPYSLFLVDVEMPGMDGFSFIARIRADADLRDTPAILVTSRNAPEDLQRGRDVGAQDYVVKGEFNQAALLSRIRELVA
jgi:two-component system chemotaxis sensor kinase CheA